MPEIVKGRLSVRLDVPTREALARYMAENAMSVSQATRVLLSLALREEGQSAEAVFRAAAFREGLVAGIAEVRNKVSTALRTSVDSALAGMDQLIEIAELPSKPKRRRR